MTIPLQTQALTSIINHLKVRTSLVLSLCLLTAACTGPSTHTPSGNNSEAASPLTPNAQLKTKDRTQPDSSSPPEKAETTNAPAKLLAAVPNGQQDGSTPLDTRLSALNVVPPDGLDSLDENGLSYFQQMGPLEYAARLGGIPETSAWRVRLRLYPQKTDTEQTYLVKLDHYNLSPALYRDLVLSYGDNTDPSLAEEFPHQNFELTFLPVMGIAAEWLAEATKVSQSSMTDNPPCGVDLGCAELRRAPVIEPTTAESISFETAPWDTTQETEQETESERLYALVRALAAQAGWRQENGTTNMWTAGEMPEGLSSDRPWVEIVVDNYIGNGSGYSAEWIEQTADDSIRQVVHQIVYDGRGETALAETKVVCAKGESAGQLLSSCL